MGQGESEDPCTLLLPAMTKESDTERAEKLCIPTLQRLETTTFAQLLGLKADIAILHRQRYRENARAKSYTGCEEGKIHYTLTQVGTQREYPVVEKSVASLAATRSLPDPGERIQETSLALLLRAPFGKGVPEPERLVPCASDDRLSIRRHGQVEDTLGVARQSGYLLHRRVLPHADLVLDLTCAREAMGRDKLVRTGRYTTCEKFLLGNTPWWCLPRPIPHDSLL